MPIRSIVVTDTYIEINRGDGPRRIDYTSIPGGAWNSARAAKAKDALQALLDTRTPRSSLPADDPAVLADPALPYFFWDGTDIVSRPAVVTAVELTGGTPPVRITLTRTW